MKKKWAVLMAVSLTLCLLSGCGIFGPSKGGVDRTENVNQEVKRADNWKQVVKDSKFQLGEIKKVSTWRAGEPCDIYTQDYGSYPNMDGSTVCIPMAYEFARQHLGFSDEQANGLHYFSTTHYAYELLIRKNAPIERYEYAYTDKNNTVIEMDSEQPVDIFLGTQPSEDELKLARKHNVTLVKEAVCYDAFVFITHKNNPVDSLSVEQVQKIYSGEITNWKDVGGRDEKITAYQREENSGSQTAMEEMVMKGKQMAPAPTVKVVAGMGELVERVAEYKNNSASIGYTYLYYINTLYKNDNIKTVKIEGVSPSVGNLRSKSYPFTVNYFGVIRSGDKDKVGGKFLQWMLSDEGQKSIKQAGYVPMRDVALG